MIKKKKKDRRGVTTVVATTQYFYRVTSVSLLTTLSPMTCWECRAAAVWLSLLPTTLLYVTSISVGISHTLPAQSLTEIL